MIRAINRNLLYCVLALTALVFFVGCSLDSASVAPQSTNDQAVGASSLSPKAPDGPAPGYVFVKSQWGLASDHDGSLDDGWSITRFVRANGGGVVSTHNIGCQIPQWALPYDANVSVNVPTPGTAEVVYGPHPTQFNAPVQLFFDLNTLILPQGTSWEDLVVFYAEDNGGYDLIGGYIDYQHHQLVAYTDHFSRYIISARVDY